MEALRAIVLAERCRVLAPGAPGSASAG